MLTNSNSKSPFIQLNYYTTFDLVLHLYRRIRILILLTILFIHKSYNIFVRRPFPLGQNSSNRSAAHPLCFAPSLAPTAGHCRIFLDHLKKYHNRTLFSERPPFLIALIRLGEMVWKVFWQYSNNKAAWDLSRNIKFFNQSLSVKS